MYYESDFELECDNECGPGPPPIFNIPPPPRPDFLQNELAASTTCSDDSLSDYEMCEAIPILDASYHSSPSLQTSAMILLCSVLLLIFIFVSSILIWKHKRKVQNFLPCKTPTRGALDPSGGMPGGQSLTYEDPDMHMGHHRPLVMRQHPLNVEMLNSKALHFPSGYPIPRSPPLFICSSPGPDPYRSNDNVYEELEHRGGGVVGVGGLVVGNNVNVVSNRSRNAIPACDRQLHSDEEFAEDELSLPGDRSLNKSSSDNTTVATIYQERGAGSTSSNNANERDAGMYLERGRVERNSLLSSASDTSAHNHAMRPNMRNSSSSNESSHHHLQQHHHHHHYNNTLNGGEQMGADANGNGGSGVASFFRFRTSRPSRESGGKGGTSQRAKNHHRGKSNNFSMNNLSSSTAAVACDEIPLSAYVNTGSSSSASTSDPISSNALINGNHIEGDTNNNNNVSNNNGNNNVCGRNNYYGIDSEVERRNRINAQLSAAATSTQTPVPNVATIFRDRNSMRSYHNHPATTSSVEAAAAAAAALRTNSNYYVPPQHIMMTAANRPDAGGRLSRTNPRSSRRNNHSNSNNSNSSSNGNNNNNNSNCSRENAVNNNNGNGSADEYLYHEPIYHHHDNMIYDPYLTPATHDNNNARLHPVYHQPYMPEFTTFRNYNNLNNPHQPLYNAMNSDSGYSQNTQNSGRSLFSRRKRNSGNNNSNSNNNNNNDDSITSTSSIVRAETAVATVDDAYLDGS